MRNHILALLLALMAVGLTGCGDSNDYNQVSGQQGNPIAPGPSPTPTPSGDAFIRVAQLADTQTDVDVLLNGVQVLTAAEQTDATAYRQVTPGANRIQVRATGTTTDLLDVTQTVAANSHNTFVVIGTNTNPQVPTQRISGLRLLALVDSITPLRAGISVRFANIVPFEETEDATLTTPEGEVLAGPVSYGQATTYRDFTSALDFDFVQVRFGEEYINYETEEGTNQNIFDTLAAALNNQPGNLTVFFGYDDDFNLPGFVLIDRGTNSSEVYVFEQQRR